MIVLKIYILTHPMNELQLHVIYWMSDRFNKLWFYAKIRLVS